MKNLFVIPILALFLTSFQSNGQCCQPSRSDAIASSAISGQQKLETVKFKIIGITCVGCSNTIYNALKEVGGVVEHSVEYPGDIAIIKFDDAKTNAEALQKVIEKKGYKAVIVKETPNNKV